MLVWCAWCPSYGREPAFLGSKPGEGVSHGICTICALEWGKPQQGKEILGSRPASGEGVISSVAVLPRTSLAIPSSGPLPAGC